MKFIADSSCDLPKELLKVHEIVLMPVYLIVDDIMYRDGVDISSEEIFEKLKRSKRPAKTAAPNPNDMTELIMKENTDENDFIIGTMSSKVSATYQNAKIVQQRLKTKNIKILDSMAGSGVLSLLMLNGALMKEKGLEIEEIFTRLSTMRDKSLMVGYIDDVTSLMRSGRISKLRYYIAKLLSAKPILTYINGEIKPLGKAMGKEKGIDTAIQNLLERLDKEQMYDLMITHAKDKKTSEKILGRLDKHLDLNRKIIAPLSPALSVHLGEGTILLSAVPVEE